MLGDSVIGQVIGNYRIVSELGKGGMGMVYRAEHTQLGKPAALKMLLPQLSSDPAIVQRFFNEARAASAIDHPGIVEVYDYGTHTTGAAYIVMALLKGESLEQRLQRGPLPPLEGAQIVSQVLGALAAAHARGIVHRDLKPDNIFLVPNELMPGGIQIKLLDFGIAKLADEKTAGFKTQTGMMMGTPAYMSPEQCMGRADLDHRTDLYSIGCILFHLLTGRPPFLGEGGTGMMIAAHIRDPAPHPRTLNPTVPDALAAIVMRLLEKEPAARFQTALEVRDALAAVGAGAPSRPPVPADQYAATIAPGSVPPVTSPYGSLGTAPTTVGGSAAEVVAQTPVVPTSGAKGRGGLVLGAGALVAVLGGVGVFVAMRGDRASAPPSPTAAAAPGAPGTSSPAAPAAPAPGSAGQSAPASSGEPTPAISTVPSEPCPLGQVRGLDTHGRCCWPEQAWSSSKRQCVGTPRCPPGHRVAGETCALEVVDVAQPQSRKPTPPASPPPHGPGGQAPPSPPPPPTPGTLEAPSLALDAKVYAPKSPIRITLSAPISSSTQSRAWITVIEASRGPEQYGAWTYLDDGVTSAVLTAPDSPGAYEVRLHTDYPRKSHNVRQRVAVQIGDGTKPVARDSSRNDQRFMLATTTATVGDHVEITFPGPMKAPDGEKYWVTVVEQAADASSYAAYWYVPDGARTMQVEMPKRPGSYEIRLHANYPRLTTNLVHRARIRVED